MFSATLFDTLGTCTNLKATDSSGGNYLAGCGVSVSTYGPLLNVKGLALKFKECTLSREMSMVNATEITSNSTWYARVLVSLSSTWWLCCRKFDRCR
jgi:hypothetical protein